MKIVVNLRTGTNAYFGYLFYKTSEKEEPFRSEVWASHCLQTHYLLPSLINSWHISIMWHQTKVGSTFAT